MPERSGEDGGTHRFPWEIPGIFLCLLVGGGDTPAAENDVPLYKIVQGVHDQLHEGLGQRAGIPRKWLNR